MKQRFLYTLAILFVSMQTFAQGTVKYEYDANNRLTQVTYDNGFTETFTYDELGNRLTMKVVGTVKEGEETNGEVRFGSLFYKLNSKDLEAEVVRTVPNRQGSIVAVPGSITYKGNVYTVTSISNTFSADAIGSITIPNSVTRIPYSAFSFKSCLRIIIVDSENRAYDSRDNCNAIIERGTNKLIVGIRTSTIPNSVECIGEYSFQNCGKLTTVTVPRSVTAIGDYAFSYCYDLTTITLGNYLTTIGNGAFKYCTGLKSVIIPNSVTNIGSDAFSRCSGLTSVVLSNSLESIEDYAFYGCENLISVTINQKVPLIIGDHTFSNCANATLYVPQGCVDAYRNADGWGEFKDIVEIISDIPGDANNDGKVDIDDINAIVHYILTGDLQGLNSKNVHGGEEGEITVVDIVKLLNKIKLTQK